MCGQIPRACMGRLHPSEAGTCGERGLRGPGALTRVALRDLPLTAPSSAQSWKRLPKNRPPAVLLKPVMRNSSVVWLS